MRGTRYLETEISSAYANQRIFDIHKLKLEKIATEHRNPFKNRGRMGESRSPRRHSDSYSPRRNHSNSVRTSGSLLKNHHIKHERYLSFSKDQMLHGGEVV